LTTTACASLNLGFLTVLQDGSGYLGGYLVTNQWGRPLEFRLSSAVQPNRVHRILYAGTLQSYLCADLIGKTLVDKTAAPARLIVTDTAACLDLRLRLDTPVVWVAGGGWTENAVTHAARPEAPEPPPAARVIRDNLHCHARFAQDAPLIEEMLEQLVGLIDLSEPFARIREAVGEARKLGVGGRS
jgi:hypothetical protein